MFNQLDHLLAYEIKVEFEYGELARASYVQVQYNLYGPKVRKYAAVRFIEFATWRRENIVKWLLAYFESHKTFLFVSAVKMNNIRVSFERLL